ncbi:MAG: hypothetical protein KC978_03100 [Candidatus Omnitrophica bacterium]|nr:hypothetical protein [Candidatus Omnitrophota bacterium]
MEAVGTMAYTVSSGSVDFMLYNSFDPEGRLQWVWWKRGVGVQNIQSQLFQARVILEWEGVDYTYDFETGGYQRLDDQADMGWIHPDSCLSHSGGTIATFGVITDRSQYDEYTGFQSRVGSTLHDLTMDSDSPLKLEIRFRPTADSEWRSRVQFMKTRNMGALPVREHIHVGDVAFAA